jgi:hypothetical protein
MAQTPPDLPQLKTGTHRAHLPKVSAREGRPGPWTVNGTPYHSGNSGTAINDREQFLYISTKHRSGGIVVCPFKI